MKGDEKMLTYDPPMPAYTVAEFEKLAGIPKNVGYALIRQKKIRAVLDVTGKYRIPYGQAYAYMERMDEK